MRDEILCNHIPDMFHHHRDSVGNSYHGRGDGMQKGAGEGMRSHTAVDEEARQDASDSTHGTICCTCVHTCATDTDILRNTGDLYDICTRELKEETT